MQSSLPVDDILLAVSALLIVGVAGAGLAHRFQLPGLLISLAAGMIVGSDGLDWVHIDYSDADWVQSISVAALVVILFNGGLSTSVRAVRQQAAPALTLATVGVGLTMVVVAVGSRLMLDVEWGTAMLIGAVVSSTDAAAVFSVLRRAPIPSRVRTLLEVESGFNDPAAMLLTIGAVEVWRADPRATDWIVFGLSQIGLGMAIGLGVGVVGVNVLQHVRLGSAARLAILAFGLGASAYAAAAVVGGSGLMACYLTGLLIGNGVRRHRALIRGLHDVLGSGAETALFLLLGLLVFPSQLGDQFFGAVAVAAILVLIARPVATVICLVWFRYRIREQTLIAWAGLRGAVPIVLATLPLTAGHPEGVTVFNQVFFVVLMSVAVQSVAVGPLARRLGLEPDESPLSAVIDTVPLDSMGELVEIELPAHAVAIGRPLRHAPPPAGARITAIMRSDRMLVPDGDTELAAGDVVLVLVPNDADIDDDDLAAWTGSALGSR